MAAISSPQGSSFSVPTPIAPPLSNSDIVEKIRSITADECALITLLIVQRIMQNLGPIAKAHIGHQVMLSVPDHDLLRMLSTPEQIGARVEELIAAVKAMKAKRTFFFKDQDQARKFTMASRRPVQNKIVDSFSSPHEFLEDGTCIQISDYEPSSFLKQLFQEINKEVTQQDVPVQYWINLKIDTLETQQRGELVFSLTATSENIEFSKEIFTLDELQKNFSEASEKFISGKYHT